MPQENCGGCLPSIPSAAAGVDGKNAYTVLTASFTQPAVSANVTVTVSNIGQFGNQWAAVGQTIFITGGGHYTVVALVGINQITVTNLGYSGNATVGATVASGGKVSPSGQIGPTGTGTPGANGTTRLYEQLTTQTTTSTLSWGAILDGYNVPANTLVNNGDALVIDAWILQSGAVTLATIPGRRITFAGQDVSIIGGINPIILQQSSTYQYRTRIELIKKSATELISRVSFDTSPSNPQSTFSITISGLNFTVANQIFLSVFQYVASGTELRSLTIDKITS